MKAAALPTQGPKKIDVNAVGLINGQPIYEYDIDTDQDEKPWRKPGAYNFWKVSSVKIHIQITFPGNVLAKCCRN